MDAPPLSPRNPNKQNNGVGPFAAIIIVVIIFAIGGLYFLITQEMKLHNAPIQETPNA